MTVYAPDIALGESEGILICNCSLILGHICPILSAMTGNEFIRKIRSSDGNTVSKWPLFLNVERSHGTLLWGEANNYP